MASNFWKKLGIWTCAKKIGDIVDYVKDNIAEAKKCSTTWQTLDFIYSLLQDIVKFYKEIDNIPVTKATGVAEKPTISIDFKTDIMRTIAKSYNK